MKNSKKTIVIDDAVPFAEALFSHLGNIVTVPGRSITAETVKHADALIVRSRTKVNSALLASSQVRFVGSTVVGLDHIDQTYLADQNIAFYSAQGCNANSVAEYILSAMLNLAEAFSFNLKEKSLAIIGVGHVGERVYQKAQSLGMTVLLNDPPKLEKHPHLKHEHPYFDLDTCLKADFITVHTPLTKTGAHPSFDLISAQKLKHIRPDQIIINAARGGVINEAAWINTQTLANIIDCWENEPNINMALYAKAWLATPHIAGHSFDAKMAGSSMVYHQLCQFWHCTPQAHWKEALPPPPTPISLNNTTTIQHALCDAVNQTHDVFIDDRAIRDKDPANIHKKYEYYRRNFPIYREWAFHTVKNTENRDLTNTLKSLNFAVLQA